MKPFEIITRRYLHFDSPAPQAAVKAFVTNPSMVGRHPFLPFLEYIVTKRKAGKDNRGKVYRKRPKHRPIAYGAHRDCDIYSYYNYLLSFPYESELQHRGISDCVTAFRALNGKCNIHFARDAFAFISTRGNCAAFALDVSDFFGSLNHQTLKHAWINLLGTNELPIDHYKVFRAITRYSKVDREQAYAALNLDPRNPRKGHLLRLCSSRQFREKIANSGLIKVNQSGVGIPQGSPISALLSNLYMLAFDTQIQSKVAIHGGLYRRYCDDILVVMPTVALRDSILGEMRAKLTNYGLSAHPDKTEVYEFVEVNGRVITTNRKTLNYLGFAF